MATTVPANADLMAIVVLGVGSVPTVIEFWLISREGSTLFITATHLMDSNVLFPLEKIGFVSSSPYVGNLWELIMELMI